MNGAEISFIEHLKTENNMRVIEGQTELGRSIDEIDTNTVKEWATLQRENVENYFSTNRTFGEKLPEVNDLSSLISLQRKYTEASWKNVSQTIETQNGIVTGAFEATRQAFSKAFTTGTSEEAATQA